MAGQDWIVGIHAVTELLKSNPQDVLELLLQQDRTDRRLDEVRELAAQLGIKTRQVSRDELEKQLLGASAKKAGNRKRAERIPVHQGVIALCQWRDNTKDEAFLTKLLDNLAHPPLLLVLDEITDPHNLGACLRTADAAGVDAVIVPKDNSAPMNLTVRKVASGAAEKVNLVAVTNLSRTLNALQQRGVWIYGTAGEADQTLYQADLKGPLALVMGSEGKGMRRLTREHCDYLLSIPMAGAVSSLNVSVAAGVCLFEAVRQRSA
ncbi:23S rRNA (guanosine(2251)-2'-O)-methyltransferase RlmB [Pseudohongiella spirulinae]|uniref:23S rRNA (guanosine-2'-O-)-methyltransferase RlmB n=1 Tax=Pseudohongiella spirulinae TaxID=1249552 RepID=A0A0S2KBF8_9GAMM|nr:23S rRNA (guanosine(2251)-2'-O)-methyltransferase RlmB [Pseudohongiella spirulinae]ALO45327.1 23S rRNA (guanosine-2'-O-)-methyltransferase RlmB [Pseudohongiella spirulinae]